MSKATEVMQTRIDYLNGCVEDLKAAIRVRDREVNRLRKILHRVNVRSPVFCKDILDLTREFAIDTEVKE